MAGIWQIRPRIRNPRECLINSASILAHFDQFPVIFLLFFGFWVLVPSAQDLGCPYTRGPGPLTPGPGPRASGTGPRGPGPLAIPRPLGAVRYGGGNVLNFRGRLQPCQPYPPKPPCMGLSCRTPLYYKGPSALPPLSPLSPSCMGLSRGTPLYYKGPPGVGLPCFLARPLQGPTPWAPLYYKGPP